MTHTTARPGWYCAALALVLATVVGLVAPASAPVAQAAVGDSLTIPVSHPRIWWTPARLQQARAWFAANPFTPKSTDALANALRYVLTGETAYARTAITLLMNFTVPSNELSGTASDTYRWNDWPPIVFDWTYDAMTQSERETFIARYDGYVDTMRKKTWGGVGQESNNYYWGYWRNELTWAIASYHHSPKAQTFLDYALVTRWEQSFLPYAAGAGLGGIPQEGTQYGRYMLGYPVIPMMTASPMGRSLLDETEFFKAAVFYLIYTTTPAPTTQGSTVKPYELFSFNDDEVWINGGSAASSLYGDFMTMAAMHWSGRPVAQYARRWLDLVRPPRSRHVAAVDTGGSQRPFDDLPLDYYGPGRVGFFYQRTGWDPQATVALLQLGKPSHTGHKHLDGGTFQIRRGTKWLTRETVGYSDRIAGYGGTVVQAPHPIAHNAVLFNGLGMANAYIDGNPSVRRVESRPTYAYAAVDLSKSYRAHASPLPERDDNPYASHVEREFVFVRPLETLVVLDRLESTSEKMPAEEVVKTFVAHFERQPQITGPNSVLGVNGEHALRLTTLVPASPAYRVVYEGDFPDAPSSPLYQYRLEVDTKGAQRSHFLHILQARDTNGPDLAVHLSETADSYTVTLEHPTKGSAVLVFQKGMVSSGGGFGYAASGLPTGVTPFIDVVQGIEVTDNGPVWQGAPQAAPTDAAIPPSVSLTAPANGTIVSGTVTVAATASDDTGVAGVQFLLDSAPLGAEDSTNTYSVSWDTTTVSAGTHTLTAVATDLDGHRGVSAPLTVTVDNAPRPVNPVAVYYEAEASAIVSAFQAEQDPQASNHLYLTTPLDIGVLTLGQTEARLPVTIPAGGPSYLWARILGPSDTQDALYIGFDGAFDRVFPSQPNVYEWVRVEVSHGSGVFAHDLTAGPHEITLSHGEPYARVDVLLVTSDPNFVPVGSPDPNPPPPPVISGIAVSNVTTDSATIAWTTDKPADSLVQYGPTTAYGSAAGDGAFVTSHASALTRLAAGTPYHFRIRSADLAGSASISGDGTFTTSAAQASAFQEANGQVVIEAEHYDATVPRSSHDWVRGTAQSSFAGDGYLEALPNTGATLNTGYVSTSPELIYQVQFTTPGTYSVWVRGAAPAGTDDSLHAGLDGTGPASADRLSGFGTSWTWKRTTMDSAPATLVVSSPGLHTIHLWMREDGLKVDKLLLRTSSSSTAPSGAGPAESPRSP